ncbi:HAD-IB family hydrolase [Candidatus Marinimicrobia bacterium]|nr:HAD-IB family hydrolase [Candidatus Neomarinimicrobiota bacterium]
MADIKKVAIFDFDGTLTKRDTLLPFLIHCFGISEVLIGLCFFSPFIISYLLKIYPNDLAKKKIIKYFFKDQKVNEIKKLATSFINTYSKKNLRKNVIKRLEWHKNKSHTIILISASLDIYVRLWGGKNKFDFIEGTILEHKNGIFTGEILGNNCYGIEKVKRLNNLFSKDFFNNEIYGYGDGDGDKYFLNLCTHKFWGKDLNLIKDYS